MFIGFAPLLHQPCRLMFVFVPCSLSCFFCFLSPSLSLSLPLSPFCRWLAFSFFLSLPPVLLRCLLPLSLCLVFALFLLLLGCLSLLVASVSHLLGRVHMSNSAPTTLTFYWKLRARGWPSAALSLSHLQASEFMFVSLECFCFFRILKLIIALFM